jgi:hypothetical protein
MRATWTQQRCGLGQRLLLALELSLQLPDLEPLEVRRFALAPARPLQPRHRRSSPLDELRLVDPLASQQRTELACDTPTSVASAVADFAWGPDSFSTIRFRKLSEYRSTGSSCPSSIGWV